MGENLAAGAGERGGGIVVGVDGSDESFAALRWALHEAVLTRQRVRAVYGWARSWNLGAEPDDEEAWKEARTAIVEKLDTWVRSAAAGIDFDPSRLELTPVEASGTAALLQIGMQAQQIAVGRRSLGRVTRWFTGSLSASLAQEAKVPVTVVRVRDHDEENVQDEIARTLTAEGSGEGDEPVRALMHHSQPDSLDETSKAPVVAGVDGSHASVRALQFAIREATIHRAQLQVLFCWQLKDVGTIPGYENAVAPMKLVQKRAEQIMHDEIGEAEIPAGLSVHGHTFHIPAAKGLISASRYAHHVVVGSRGLSGLDAHFLGSVSKQVVTFAECTVTVVH